SKGVKNTHNPPLVKVDTLDGSLALREIGFDFKDMTGPADPEVKPVGVLVAFRPLDFAPDPELVHQVARLNQITSHRRRDDIPLISGLLSAFPELSKLPLRMVEQKSCEGKEPDEKE